jgi:GntR family transcriptional regulator, carbon starvation induced regulator
MDQIARSHTNNLDEPDTSATQRTYRTIRAMILEGVLRPGQKLKIGDLKVQIDAGASPIREALSLLTSDILVERIDQRGFRAAPVSQSNFDEILRLRCALEDMALRGSIASGGSDWEERVVLAHHRMVQARRDPALAFEDRHKAFHMTILDQCGSPIQLKFCAQLYDLNVRYRNLAGKSQAYVKRNIDDEHKAIFDAVIMRDAEKASAHLIEHYHKTGAFLRASLAA